MERRRFIESAFAVALTATGSRTWADVYPSRAIHVLVPAPAGGPLDVRMRLIGEKLSQSLGQQIVVDNKPGASGTLAGQLVAQAKPDGYTLFMGHSGTHSLAPHLQAKPPYDPLRDFTPVSLVVVSQHFIFVRSDSPIRSVPDLVASARARPGALTYGSAGAGSPQHVETALFLHMTGTTIQHVPYKGSAPTIAALLGGEIDMAFDAFVPGMEHVRSGRLRVLATTRSRRMAAFPDIPSIAESVPGYEMKVWVGMFAPPGTPRDVVAKLNRAFVQALATPELVKNLQDTGAETEPLTPDQFGALVRDEWVKGRRQVEVSGARQL